MRTIVIGTDKVLFLSLSQQSKSGLGHLFLDHPQLDTYTHTTRQDSSEQDYQPVAVTDTYIKRHKHNRQTPMLSAGFEPAMPATSQ
jgi:hypothetical protein